MSDETRNLLLQIGVISLTLVVPVLVAYVRVLARRLAALLDIQLSEQQWKDVDATIELSVYRGEEFGHKQIARGLGITSEEKLQAAIDTARRVGPRGLVDYDDDALRDMLEAKLQKLRPSLPPAPVKPPASLSILPPPPRTGQ